MSISMPAYLFVSLILAAILSMLSLSAICLYHGKRTYDDYKLSRETSETARIFFLGFASLLFFLAIANGYMAFRLGYAILKAS